MQEGVRQLAQFLAILIITTHWFSCLFFALGDFSRMEASCLGGGVTRARSPPAVAPHHRPPPLLSTGRQLGHELSW